jgi:hypothetical protein
MSMPYPHPPKLTQFVVSRSYGFRLDANWQASRSWMQSRERSDASDGTSGYPLRARARVRARKQLTGIPVRCVRRVRACAIKWRVFVAVDRAHERKVYPTTQRGGVGLCHADRGRSKVQGLGARVPHRAFPRKISKFNLKSPPPVCSRPIRGRKAKPTNVIPMRRAYAHKFGN